MAGTFLQALVLVLAVNTALGLSCFNCNSRTESKCDDPFVEAAMVYKECNTRTFSSLVSETLKGIPEVQQAFNLYPSEPPGEDITCQKFIFDDGTQNITIRTCSVREIRGLKTCNLMENKLRTEMVFCEQCESSLCNTSSVMFSSALLCVIFSLTAIGATF
ncbi:uncharacterized protein [Periplaneta americana]|uniref:uncharacterized protein n=1 Tax=Periplaneta americana TaxID=6978 RepID=UPI0037E90627